MCCHNLEWLHDFTRRILDFDSDFHINVTFRQYCFRRAQSHGCGARVERACIAKLSDAGCSVRRPRNQSSIGLPLSREVHHLNLKFYSSSSSLSSSSSSSLVLSLSSPILQYEAYLRQHQENFDMARRKQAEIIAAQKVHLITVWSYACWYCKMH